MQILCLPWNIFHFMNRQKWKLLIFVLHAKPVVSKKDLNTLDSILYVSLLDSVPVISLDLDFVKFLFLKTDC